MEQLILSSENEYAELNGYLADNNICNIFLVCDSAYGFLKIKDYFDELEDLGVEITKFSDFQPNPLYESVVEGVRLFKESGAKIIVAVGGGSAMDVAKCIKLYSNMDPSKNYLEQEIVPNDVTLLAIPTTAGTGSEATRFAVIYYEGKKQSVADYSIIPSVVLFDESSLKTLPLYQKKSTMLDAFCHAIESYWSVNSNDESKEYSKKAVKGILDNLSAYLANDEAANREMMNAAHYAGKAINITQTTAGHAMCYKLTSLYHVAHGHAAALVDVKLFPYMVSHTEDCVDPRGEKYLKKTFEEIAEMLGCKTTGEACVKLQEFFNSLELQVPEAAEEDYAELRTSVNPVRLKNNPVKLDEENIESLYRLILK
ncbi:MAG: phosphonoacetaldehyde reductase [Ruminococcaceae bacterium]|nr:phosphonoacetaldehyde reductase [Oscillospiraceae bacterium]